MTHDHKVWTKKDVDEFLANIDYEAARQKTHAFNYYLDEGDKVDGYERAVFIVKEWVRPDHFHNIKSSTVRGVKKYGWLWDAFNARKRREEYGDVGDHCLISREDAEAELLKMGLKIEDAERYLLRSFSETNGYDPVMLPVDPKWQQRRDKAQARLQQRSRG